MATSLSFMDEAKDAYNKALKAGRREGASMLCLDDILKQRHITAPQEMNLGVIQIPIDQIVGSKSAGRTSAFSRSFLPLLDPGTEFATKWIHLYASHLEEGIHDSIKVYEFLNKFYVEEGNKRVSVLRSFGAVSIMADVIRIIPPSSDDPEIRKYYEFMGFYALSKVNYISFSKEGGYAKLQRRVGKLPDEVWDDEDRMIFNSTYTRFCMVYEKQGGSKLPILPGDAFLHFIGIYDYKELGDMTVAEISKKVEDSFEEFKLLLSDRGIEIQLDPVAPKKPSVLTKLLGGISSSRLSVAFIHQKTIDTSGWTYSHELGKMDLEERYKDSVNFKSYFEATPENAEALINQAIAEGHNLIFTTAPTLLTASLKCAIENPKVNILNCSLNVARRYVRTYYARMYEAKFLMGAIAGALTENNKIGYVADYPIYGMMSNVNAFALGAKMINPRAKVYLDWSTIKDNNPLENFIARDIRCISGLDLQPSSNTTRNFGLFYLGEDRPANLAMPIWDWGKFYEGIIYNILSTGKITDKSEEDDTKGQNYWWGMSTGIVDVICSKYLPIGTTRLVDLLRKTICHNDFNPFSGILYAQDKVINRDTNRTLTPEEIINMDWLSENVIGSIPDNSLLVEDAKPVVNTIGVKKHND